MSGCFPRILPPDETRRDIRASGAAGDAPAADLLPDAHDEPTGSRPRPDLQAAIDAFFDGQETSFASKTAA